MKNIFRFPIIILSLLLLTATQCKKSPALPEFYYRCKVDGQDYRPNGCANCLTCTILGDTVFLLGANRGYEVVLIGITGDPTINNKRYILKDSATGGLIKTQRPLMIGLIPISLELAN